MKRIFAILLALCMLLALMAGCGSAAGSEAPAASASEAETQTETAEAPAAEAPAEEAPEAAASAEEISAEEPAEAAEDGDFTASNADMDFGPYKEMLKDLTTDLPITDEGVTLSYFFGFEGSTLNYIEGGEIFMYYEFRLLLGEAFL